MLEPITMEMIFKVPKDKPPFVGIRFNDSYAAVHTNKEMIEEFKKQAFTLSVECAGPSVNLRLTIESPVRIWRYNGVKIDYEKLKLFIRIPAKQWNFGHVIDVKGSDQVVRTIPSNQIFTISIRDLRVLDEY